MNYKTIEYKGIGTAGFIGSNYSGTTSITGVSAIDSTKFQAYKIKLNLEKFSTINKVKLLVYPIGTSKPIMFLKQTSSLTSNVGTSLGGAVCNLAGVYEFDITELFIDNMNGNKFFTLTSKTAMQMYNHDSPTESKRPTLVVEYIDKEHGLSKEQIVAFGVGDNMEFNLDVRSGASKFSKQLLSYGGENMPFNLSLAFNAINKTEVTSVGMPSGWKFNYQHKLVESGSDYIYTDGRGDKHRFKKALNSTTVFYDVAGTGLIMIVGSGYKIIDCYNNELHFNTNGLLTSIVKKHGNNAITTTITYDSNYQMIKVIDGMGREFDFSYNSSSVVVSRNQQVLVTLNKNSSNQLVSITELGNRLSNFTYTSSLLSTIHNDNGDKLTLTYDSDDRVTKVAESIVKDTETEVKHQSFYYKVRTTSSINHLTKEEAYFFDNDGDLITKINDTKHIKNLNISDFERVMDTVYKETYEAFEDKTLTISSDTNVNLTKLTSESQGVLDLTSGNEFVLSFNYSVTTPSSSDVRVLVKQDEYTLINKLLHTSTKGEKYVSIKFDIPVDEEEIKVCIEGTNVVDSTTFTVKNIKISPYRVNRSLFCIDKVISSDYNVTLGGIRWYKLGDVYDKAYYNTSTELPERMYPVDLLENQKNINTTEFKNYYWYDKKRGLVVTDNVKLRIGEVPYTISELKFGTIKETTKDITVAYSDYIVTTGLRKDYEITKTSGVEYKNETVIDDNFFTTSKKDYNGIITTYTPDSYGRVLSEVVSHANSSSTFNKEYVYEDNYLKSEKAYVNGTAATTTYAYTPDTGLISQITYPSGQVVSYTYDEAKKLTNLSSNGNNNNITYNKELVTLLQGSGIGHGFEYGKFNELKQVYHGHLLVEEIETEMGTHEVTQTHNLKRGTPIYLKKHYDKYGNLFSVEKSTNNSAYTPAQQFFYSDKDVDKLEDLTTANPLVCNTTSSSKLRKVVDNEVSNVQRLRYDGLDRLSKVTNSNTTHYPSESKYSYDSNNRLTKLEQTVGDNDFITTTITYKNKVDDEISTVNSLLKYSHNTVSDSIASTSNDEFECSSTNTTDSFKRLISKNYIYDDSKSKTVTYTYQNVNNKTNNLITKEQHSGFTTGTLNYMYDMMGRIVNVTDGTYKTMYTYDTLGRLIRENNQRLNKTVLFTYDTNGNITEKEEGVYQTSVTPTITKTDTFEYSENVSDLMVKHNSNTITNSLGLPVSYNGASFTWVRGGLLSRLSYSSSKYLDYAYNANGIRVRKDYYDNGVLTSHLYKLDGKKIIHERIMCGNDVSELSYLYLGNELVGFVHNGDKYYYQKNIRNDIIGLYNSSGSLVAKYEYDAWGNHKVYSSTGVENTSATFIGNINPFRYRGYYFDRETKLYYCNARYYNPEWCRWISPDSVKYLEPQSINGLNLYAYCGNDPVNMYDTSGHIAIKVIIAICITIAVLATINDICQIARKNVYVDLEKTNLENVHVQNSYKIFTPWMRFGYSFYLNHINPNTKDVIQGSTVGVQLEWELHNYAAWLGFGGESAKDLDVGRSIFADGKSHPLLDEDGNITKTGVMSLVMRVYYIWFGNPILWLWDLYVNGGF